MSTPEIDPDWEEEYVAAHSDAEPAHLRRLRRHTYHTRTYPRMCSGHIQGRLLRMLTQMIAPRRVLELGTFTGYATLCFAEGLQGDAFIDTVEVDTEHAPELRELFSNAPHGQRVRLHVADAEEFLGQCAPESYDLIFIDADKRRYEAYYRLALRALRPGGYILADNTLWGGKVGHPILKKDPQTQGIEAFNAAVASDPAVEKVIIPLRDGLTLIRKKEIILAPLNPMG